MTERVISCSDCATLACRGKQEEKYPQFCLTEKADPELLQQALDEYKDELWGKIAVTAACIEGESYGRLTRVEETIEFIKRMGFEKVGVASCVGLMTETKIFTRLLAAHGIDYYTVSCKIGAVDKTEIGIPAEKKMNGGCAHESMCNPVMQAKALEAAGCDFAVMIGLCVGHDTLFLHSCKLPTTVMVVKDRVLAHNSAAALYTANTMYSRFKKEMGL